jgi:O-antigen ligase
MKATLIIRAPRVGRLPRALRPGLRLGLLAQIGVCVLPSMTLLALRQPLWGGRCFFGLLLVILASHLLRGHPLPYTAILIGVMPAMMLFRDFLFYSSVQVLLAACMLLWLFAHRERIAGLLSNLATRLLLILATAYWVISYVVTGDYASNYRAFELAFAACAVFLLARHRSYLATAFLGLGLTVCAVGAGMLPNSVRLGMVEFGRMRLGNPIQLGNPCALVFLLTIVDGGSLLGLRGRRSLTLIIRMMAAIWLLLSTSRGAWMVVIIGMIALFLADRAQRKAILLSLGLVVVAAGVLISIGHSAILLDYVEKTFSSDISWNKRTTGRADQWRALPQVIRDSPVWGFGPGTGRDTAGVYAGRRIVWHSFYLQMIAETGLLGALICIGGLAAMLAKAIQHRRRAGETAPLIGVLGYLTIGMSVPGIDGNSAMFLGLGLLAGDYSRLWVLHPAPSVGLGRAAAAVRTMHGSGVRAGLPVLPSHLPPSVLGAGSPPPSGPTARPELLLAAPPAND